MPVSNPWTLQLAYKAWLQTTDIQKRLSIFNSFSLALKSCTPRHCCLSHKTLCVTSGVLGLRVRVQRQFYPQK
eukprot:4025511-Amphidinium_carterae.2